MNKQLQLIKYLLSNLSCQKQLANIQIKIIINIYQKIKQKSSHSFITQIKVSTKTNKLKLTNQQDYESQLQPFKISIIFHLTKSINQSHTQSKNNKQINKQQIHSFILSLQINLFQQNHQKPFITLYYQNENV
ncbi:hypothetical protein ABPG72_017929 [Tetrahymena utriculariae]